MLDRDLAAAARRRHGVITQHDLDALGASDRQRRTRLESGALIRLHGSVLAVAGAPATFERDATAALEALPDGALGHRAAGRIHGMEHLGVVVKVSVLAPADSHHDLRGVDVRRTRCLPASHVTVVDGLRVTTRCRTIVDLAADLSDGRLRRLIEDEMAGRRIDWDDLVTTFAEMATRGRPGVARMRRVLQRIEGDPPTESELERMYLRLLEGAGIVAPEMQVTAPWAERQPGRVDAMYPATKAIIELDGRGSHIRALAFEDDRRRDQLAVLEGYSATRFTYRQVTGDPDFVVEVTRHLARRPHG